MKASCEEPAERPHLVLLSVAEIIALAKYHTQHARRIPKVIGKILLEESANRPLLRSRANSQLIETGKSQVESHIRRAQGLLSIIK